METYDKYIKYKKKYINLKEQYGNAHGDDYFMIFLSANEKERFYNENEILFRFLKNIKDHESKRKISKENINSLIQFTNLFKGINKAELEKRTKENKIRSELYAKITEYLTKEVDSTKDLLVNEDIHERYKTNGTYYYDIKEEYVKNIFNEIIIKHKDKIEESIKKNLEDSDIIQKKAAEDISSDIAYKNIEEDIKSIMDTEKKTKTIVFRVNTFTHIYNKVFKLIRDFNILEEAKQKGLNLPTDDWEKQVKIYQQIQEEIFKSSNGYASGLDDINSGNINWFTKFLKVNASIPIGIVSIVETGVKAVLKKIEKKDANIKESFSIIFEENVDKTKLKEFYTYITDIKVREMYESMKDKNLDTPEKVAEYIFGDGEKYKKLLLNLVQKDAVNNANQVQENTKSDDDFADLIEEFKQISTSDRHKKRSAFREENIEKVGKAGIQLSMYMAIGALAIPTAIGGLYVAYNALPSASMFFTAIGNGFSAAITAVGFGFSAIGAGFSAFGAGISLWYTSMISLFTLTGMGLAAASIAATSGIAGIAILGGIYGYQYYKKSSKKANLENKKRKLDSLNCEDTDEECKKKISKSVREIYDKLPQREQTTDKLYELIYDNILHKVYDIKELFDENDFNTVNEANNRYYEKHLPKNKQPGFNNLDGMIDYMKKVGFLNFISESYLDIFNKEDMSVIQNIILAVRFIDKQYKLYDKNYTKIMELCKKKDKNKPCFPLDTFKKLVSNNAIILKRKEHTFKLIDAKYESIWEKITPDTREPEEKKELQLFRNIPDKFDEKDKTYYFLDKDKRIITDNEEDTKEYILNTLPLVNSLDFYSNGTRKHDHVLVIQYTIKEDKLIHSFKFNYPDIKKKIAIKRNDICIDNIYKLSDKYGQIIDEYKQLIENGVISYKPNLQVNITVNSIQHRLSDMRLYRCPTDIYSISEFKRHIYYAIQNLREGREKECKLHIELALKYPHQQLYKEEVAKKLKQFMNNPNGQENKKDKDVKDKNDKVEQVYIVEKLLEYYDIID
jgi:hypothetical protein